MTIEKHRQLHFLLRLVMLFGIGTVLYVTQPPGIWGLVGFLVMGLMIFVGATIIAMRIPARCALAPGCDGASWLRSIDRHHWYVCERCGDRQDGGSQRMGSGT